MSDWDLKNTVVGSWPFKNIFLRKKKRTCLHSSKFQGKLTLTLMKVVSFRLLFWNSEALQVIGTISSLDMQIKFKLEMTEMEKQPQQEKKKEGEEREARQKQHWSFRMIRGQLKPQ